MRRLGSFPSLPLLVAGLMVITTAASLTSLAAAAPSSHLATKAASSAKISAHLAKTSFTPAQAGSVKLIYRFSKRSKSFSYKLTFKQGSKWQTVKSVKKKGSFKGKKSMTVKKLFAGKPVKVGRYRLKLSSGLGSVTLSFKVEKGKILTGVRAVSLGWLHTCALLYGGTVECWGSNYYDQLGNGTAGGDVVTPVQVSGIRNATAISAAGFYTCALISGGTVECWGDNGFGQLGDGVTDHGHATSIANDVSPTPVQVSGITNATQISAGYGHACALISGGTVECWGDNGAGALGDGVMDHGNGMTDWSESDFSPTPVQVSGITNAVQVSAGFSSSCALLADGTIDCWGDNGAGELGNGSMTYSSTPVAVSGITNVTAVSAGTLNICALISSAAIECWGDNPAGQLGDGVTNHGNGTDWYGNDFSSTPVRVSGIANAIQVSARGNTCALLYGGTINCWGGNGHGALGDGVTNHGHQDYEGEDFSPTPVPVRGIPNVVQVSAGFGSSCALISGGTVDCWGWNGNGQLGDGKKVDSSTPVSVVGLG